MALQDLTLILLRKSTVNGSAEIFSVLEVSVLALYIQVLLAASSHPTFELGMMSSGESTPTGSYPITQTKFMSKIH